MKNFIKKLLILCNTILYLVVIALWIALPEEMTLNISVTVFNLCFSAIIIIWNRVALQKYYTSSWFRRFTTTLVSAFLIFLIIGMVNYLSFKHSTQYDLSNHKMNSLTDQSISAVKKIEGTIRLTVFSQKKSFLLIQRLLELYKFHNSGVIIDFVDIEVRPDLVEQFEIKQTDTVMVEYQGRKHQINKLDELNITNAIIKVSRKKDPILYYVTGHHGPDFLKTDKNGFSEIRNFVEKSYYRPRPIDLNLVSSISEDADGLIIWGPKLPFLPNEIAVIEKYLRGGGKLLLAVDPDFKEDKFPALRSLLRARGVELANNIVIDTLEHVNGSNGTVPLVRKFKTQHPILDDLPGPVFFPLSSSISKTMQNNTPGSLKLLAQTTIFPASWAENTPGELIDGKVEFNQERDQKGPVAMLGVWQDATINSKMAVFGNSTFVQNIYAKFGMNFLLFIKSLSWLVDDDQIKSFNLPLGKDEPIFIGKTQIGIIFYFSVIVGPLLLFATSFYFYRRRRRY